MIARFTTTPGNNPEERQYLEIDITEAEMEEIKKNGKYPESRVVVYSTDENGNKIKDSEVILTVSVGELV